MFPTPLPRLFVKYIIARNFHNQLSGQTPSEAGSGRSGFRGRFETCKYAS